MHHTDTAVIIVNPTSGRERAPKFLPLLQTTLAEKYEHVVTKETTAKGDAERWAAEAAKENFDVFCMGGDGTVNETVSGILSAEGTETVFGFIPLGTVNDLARALHIPRFPVGAIRMLKTATQTKIDIGRINDRYFINIVAAGLIPEAVSQVTIREKTIFGSLAYFMKGLQVLGKQPNYRFHIVMEDGTEMDTSSPLMAAMLTDSAGSFRNLLPPEDRKKGFIKLALFRNFDWSTVIFNAPILLSGRQVGPDFVNIINLKKARISLANGEELSTNVDGEVGPMFPLNLELLPDRLSVFVPARQFDEALYYPRVLHFMKESFLREARARLGEIESIPEHIMPWIMEREEKELRALNILPEKSLNILPEKEEKKET